MKENIENSTNLEGLEIGLKLKEGILFIDSCCIRYIPCSSFSWPLNQIGLSLTNIFRTIPLVAWCEVEVGLSQVLREHTKACSFLGRDFMFTS